MVSRSHVRTKMSVDERRKMAERPSTRNRKSLLLRVSEFIRFRLRIIALNFEQADANLDGRSGVELIRDDEAVW